MQPTPERAASVDLRIADLPEDLRPEGERLKVEYRALAKQAGLVNSKGEYDPAKLDDLAFLRGADQDVLIALLSTGAQLRELAEPVHSPEYALLPDALRREVSRAEYASEAFASEASAHGFSPFQWAGVRTVVRQSGRKVTPATFVSGGDRSLVVEGDLDLRGCTSLTVLPDALGVVRAVDHAGPGGIPVSLGGSLLLQGCTSLESLPSRLYVVGDLDLRGCSPAVQDRGRALKADEWIEGAVLTS